MKFKRFTAVFVAVVMTVGMIPSFAFADEPETEPAGTSVVETTEPKAKETAKPAEKETEKPTEKETEKPKKEEPDEGSENETAAPGSKETEPSVTVGEETGEPKEAEPSEPSEQQEDETKPSEPTEPSEPAESSEPSESENKGISESGAETDEPEESKNSTVIGSKNPGKTNPDISARLSDCDLGTAVAGYDKMDFYKGLYVTNTGSEKLSGTYDCMKVELTSGDKSAFDLRFVSSGVMSSGGVCLKSYVYPKAGLSAGSYSATATLYYDEDGKGGSHGWAALGTAQITFTVLAAGTKHNVTIVNGTADKSTASEGEIVKLTPSVPANKAFSKWEVISGTVNFIYTNEFLMPNTDVTIKAVFVDKIITATLNDLDLGIAPTGFKSADYYGRMTMDNTGTKYINGAADSLRVELTGGDKNAFNLKHDSCGVIKPNAHVLAAEITPKAGLAKGTYTATVTLYYDEDGTGTYHDWVVLDTATVTITVMTRKTGLVVESYTAIIKTDGTEEFDGEEVSGTVRFDKTTVSTGDIVTVYAIPKTGYELSQIKWQNAATSPWIDITSEREFQVRDYDPTVLVYFRKLKPDDPVKYTAHVTLMCPTGIDSTGKSGTVILDKYQAQSGETINVTCIPNSGYVYCQMIWTDGLRGSSIDITSTRSFKVGNNDPYIYVLFWTDPVPNTLFSVKPKTAKVKYKKLKKKKQIVARSRVLTVSNAKGNLKYSLVKVKRGKSKKYKKYFKINSKTGTVTVKKKLRKGTYKITCKVTDSGNTAYKSATKTVTFKIKVK